MAKPLKYPVSALVVLHDGDGSILLIERTHPKGFWQSVTGSSNPGKPLPKRQGAKFGKKPAYCWRKDSFKTGTTARFTKSTTTGGTAIQKACLKTANTSSLPKSRVIRPSPCNPKNTSPTVGSIWKKRRKKYFPRPTGARFWN